MTLKLIDLVLLAGSLVIVYAIFLTLQSIEEGECDNSLERSNEAYQADNDHVQKQQSDKRKKGEYVLDQYVTIPNILSLLRIILLIPILLCFYSQFWLVTLGLFIMSAATDALDGIIARRWHMESHLGRMFDPLADKVTFVTLIALFGWNVLTHQLLFMLLAEELILLLIGGYTYFRPKMQRRITLGANTFGKAKTCCETLLVILLITRHFFMQPDPLYLHIILSGSIFLALASIIRHVRIHPLT